MIPVQVQYHLEGFLVHFQELIPKTEFVTYRKRRHPAKQEDGLTAAHAQRGGAHLVMKDALYTVNQRPAPHSKVLALSLFFPAWDEDWGLAERQPFLGSGFGTCHPPSLSWGLKVWVTRYFSSRADSPPLTLHIFLPNIWHGRKTPCLHKASHDSRTAAPAGSS